MNVGQCTFELFGAADDEGFGAGIPRVAGQRHALAIHHVQNGKLDEIPKAAVLHRLIGEKNGVGAGFEAHRAALGFLYQAQHDQMLYDVHR